VVFAVGVDAMRKAERAEQSLLAEAQRLSGAAPRIARAVELSARSDNATVLPASAMLAFALAGEVLVVWGLLLVGLGWSDPGHRRRAAVLTGLAGLLLPAVLYGLTGGLPILLGVPFLVKAVACGVSR
jgi:hypothetical protein